MVGGAPTTETAGDRADEALARIGELGGQRLTAARTRDGLVVVVPLARRRVSLVFICVFLAAWLFVSACVVVARVGEALAVSDLSILLWLGLWVAVGGILLWSILWQLSGEERLSLDAGKLTREWTLLGLRGRRVVGYDQIRDIIVEHKSQNNVAGRGTIRMLTADAPIRIAAGLPAYEAELVARLVRGFAAPAPTKLEQGQG